MSAPETAFYCNATWHLVRLSRISQSVYSLACVVAKKSGLFSASAKNVADFLGYEEKQVRRGSKELEEVGFFEFESAKEFDTNVYRVLTHKQWAAKHPNKCAAKQDFGWHNPGDPLAPQLYAVSGRRKKFKEYQMRLLRKTNLQGTVLLQEFERFVSHWRPQNKVDGQYWFSRFYDTLKGLQPSPRPYDVLVRNLYETFGHVPDKQHRTILMHVIKKGGSPEGLLSVYQNFLNGRSSRYGALSDFCRGYGASQLASASVASEGAIS